MSRSYSPIKSFFLTLGGVGALGATTYYLLLGCASLPADVRTSQSMPVTLLPAGARLDDAQGRFSVDSNAPIKLDWRSACPEKPTTDNFSESANSGGAPVRITYPGLNAPLYGLLALCELPSDYMGAASRSYRLEIPQSYVDATEGGRVSVVFEPFDYGGGERIAWALWLSRNPDVFGIAAPKASEEPHRLGGSAH